MQIAPIGLGNYRNQNCRSNFRGTGKIVTEIQDDLWKVANLKVGGDMGIHVRPATVISDIVAAGRKILKEHGLNDPIMHIVSLVNKNGNTADAGSTIDMLCVGFRTGDQVQLKTHKVFPNEQYEKLANTILEPNKLKY